MAAAAAAAMVAQAEVDAVLVVCGIVNAQHRQQLVTSEGFTTLEMFGVMGGDQDVVDMAKRLAGRPTASRLNLGTIQIKALQPLVWWRLKATRTSAGFPVGGSRMPDASASQPYVPQPPGCPYAFRLPC